MGCPPVPHCDPHPRKKRGQQQLLTSLTALRNLKLAFLVLPQKTQDSGMNSAQLGRAKARTILSIHVENTHPTSSDCSSISKVWEDKLGRGSSVFGEVKPRNIFKVQP